MMQKFKVMQLKKGIATSIISILLVFVTSGCEKFFNPTQELIIKEDDFFNDWYDYRSAEMGLYALQQDLAEQLLILGELRGDLITTTENASSDLRAVNNFEINEMNKYASPQGFYKLIAACNNLQRTLETYHPEVTKDTTITNYHKLYGEVILMRSWAYFNAVRIYRSIPWIPVSITSIDEIREFVNSPQTVMDEYDILFVPDGRYNDTVWYDTPKQLENAYLDLDGVVDSCTHDILTNVRATGVNHYIDNNDASWEVTVWNEYAKSYLLGQMYLFQGDLENSIKYFNDILYITDLESNDIRYGLTNTFRSNNWKNILTGINMNEHIFVIWFGKSNQQTNNFQKYFSQIPPNTYELKPTKQCVHYWETIWDNYRYKFKNLTDHSQQRLSEFNPGRPGDFYRGPNVSYAYVKDEHYMTNSEIQEMLNVKRDQNDFEVDIMMEGYDTVVYKYTLPNANDPFAHDANFIVARAAGVHLYAAEIYTYYAWNEIGEGNYQPTVSLAEQFLNDGSYDTKIEQLGVRGRVGYADYADEQVLVQDIIYTHDPFTNAVNGFLNLSSSLIRKQEYFEEKVLEERARELAFEGERFYDLIRIAKRRDDPSFLANMVASKFSGAQAEEIRIKLMDENNWYLPFYLGADE